MKKQLIYLFLAVSIVFTACSENETGLSECSEAAETGTITPIGDDEAHVYTSIVIDATPNQVWSVLVDFASYENWSSSFQGLTGDVRDGGLVNALFPLQDGTIAEFPHELIYNEYQSFGWSDEISTLPGIVDNHFYTVETCGNQTLFVQTDEFKGNNVNVPAIGIANALLPGYQIFNQDLKAEVERRFN